MTYTDLTPNRQQNPLDLLEEIATANEWIFDRSSHEELGAEAQGRWSDYRILAVWMPELSALHFSSQLELKVPPLRRTSIQELIVRINSKLWLGHFDLSPSIDMPVFRHTLLLKGSYGASAEQLEDVIDFSVAECERFFPAFQHVIWGGKKPGEALAASLIDPTGAS